MQTARAPAVVDCWTGDAGWEGVAVNSWVLFTNSVSLIYGEANYESADTCNLGRRERIYMLSGVAI